MTSLFPDICTDGLAASRNFYRDLLGFEVIFENAWYVQMNYPLQPAAQMIPAATCAVTLHRGSYDELGLAHHALFAWAQERGHEAHGAVREIYQNDPTEVDEDALETEVLLPLGDGT